MRMMKEGKKKYVTPSVCVHEMESCPLLAGSEGGHLRWSRARLTI